MRHEMKTVLLELLILYSPLESENTMRRILRASKILMFGKLCYPEGFAALCVSARQRQRVGNT